MIHRKHCTFFLYVALYGHEMASHRLPLPSNFPGRSPYGAIEVGQGVLFWKFSNFEPDARWNFSVTFEKNVTKFSAFLNN